MGQTEAGASTGGMPSSPTSGDGGGGAQDSPDGASSDASGGETSTGNSIVGVVLDFATKRPLAGAGVSIRATHVNTDDSGGFELPKPSDSYDVTIESADGSSVSIYRGLTRSDPVLLHRQPSRIAGTEHSARISGTLAKPSTTLISMSDIAAVTFVSGAADDQVLLGSDLPPFGPNYQLFLSWDGNSSLSGKLFARGVFAGDEDAGTPVSRFFVEEDVTLHDGDMQTDALTFAPVTTKQLSGTVTLPSDADLSQLQEYYRLPLPNAVIAIGNYLTAIPTFTHDIDVLPGAEKQLCVAAISNTSGLSSTERCGIQLDSMDTALVIQAPPAFVTAPTDGTFSTGTRFSWQPFDRGIHVLQLEPAEPSATVPSIDIYTSGTSASWPSATVALPTAAEYDCVIGGIGPFTSMDDATAPNALGALIPTESRRSFSAALELTTAP